MFGPVLGFLVLIVVCAVFDALRLILVYGLPLFVAVFAAVCMISWWSARKQDRERRK